MDDRKRQVLRAIVTDYVDSREPVGSKALVERHNLGVSPATIRNDMAVLEEEGYIMQPHTSAGRIPTDKGYRLFVDQLAEIKPLSGAEKRAITTFMSGAADLDDIVARTVRLLARATQQVAIVQYPILSNSSVRHIELLSLSPDRTLVIAISSTGKVEQRNLLLNLGEDDLTRVKNRINKAVVGLATAEALTVLETLGEQFDPPLRPSARVVVAAVIEMLGLAGDTRVVVGGVPNLTRFGEDFESTIAPVLEALEEQVVLLRLLGEAASGDEVTVRIGRENPFEQLQSTSMVAAGYGNAPDTWATLGIVGPTRMDYPSTIASVRAVARYVGRFLSEG
ncbi:heat-inducible transcriptional repressor HrcA [Granulicoccus phenolivorans]|uniref:heat-inducible transcriptional repressor HrcA n=1 Tax=Granulicoccus phenolivorans TaxID=266854 RepID=UPI000420746E|nr:heat-inducible transcriptional repressor HrcA [Granulicoccus phenolivorans]